MLSDVNSPLRYHVIHKQWIRWSDNNGEHIVYSTNRIREAKGMAHHHFISHMDMMARHDYLTYSEDFELDEDNLWIALSDEEGIWYYVGYEIVEFKEIYPEGVLPYTKWRGLYRANHLYP